MTNNRQPTNLIDWLDSIYYLAYAASVGLIAMVVVLAYVELSDMPSCQPYLAGSVARPFVYRALAPALARVSSDYIPGQVLQAALDNIAIRAAVEQISSQRPVDGVAVLAMLWASLLAALIGLVVILRHYGYPDRWALFGGPLILVAAIILLFTPMAYLYDLPTLALWTWCIVVIIQRRPWWMILSLFVLANISKETSMLLVLVWAAITWDERWSMPWLRRLAALIGAAGAVRLVLLFAFANNPGSVAQWHLPDFIWGWDEKPLAMLLSIIITMGWGLLIAWGWHEKPPELRRALVIMPPLIGLYLLFGMPGELRVFAETSPILIPMILGGSENGISTTNHC
jgi:hypothetical protein